MVTDLQLLNIKAEGLRCPDYTLDFGRKDGSARSIVLIQMPNGTGKTTTLELLRAAFAGPEYWEQQGVQLEEFARKDGPGIGRFRVQLLHNERRLTIELTLDFDVNSVRYTTTLPSGIKQGFHPPTDLARFFRPEFVNLFAFDGELANKLLDAQHTSAQRAIESLFQLHLFDSIRTLVREYWEKETANYTATEERGYSRRKNFLKRVEDRLAKVQREKETDEAKYAALKAKLDKKENEFNDALQRKDDYGERLRNAEVRRENAQNAVKTLRKELLDDMRDPYALAASFGQELVALKHNLDQAKLPESASREFFLELAEGDECICGESMDASRRQRILTRADRYLGSDNVSFLNALKSDVATLVGDDPDQHATSLQESINDVITAIEEDDEARNQLEQVEQDGASTDPHLKGVLSEISQLRGKVKEIEIRCERYDLVTHSDNPEDTWNLDELETLRKKAEDRLAEITETLELKEKRDRLTKILESAQDIARRTLSQEIRDEINSRIESLMPYNDIRISAVEQSVKLQGQRGGSVGETLTVAYAFLATIFNRSNYKLPFIVDSPANSLDDDVRREVARLVPKLANQFIAFVISSERPSFVSSIDSATNGDLLYLTLFRKGNAKFEKQARQASNFQETRDGMVVTDKKFFNSFQLDQEDDV